ncbi:MAG: SDR family NAD(P)-dependent oxidoreductase [Rhodothermales bacterium]|nr:SDR family NAD(P)-dependent oxidoreductase [Rhodothermales bacterium]MBO6778955.1 SDR family NAD(P)-dependent oxidoreductase [Rhodothermales bacterium]
MSKRIWITGASYGIGEALAVEYAAQGANVVLSARSADRLEETRLRCERPDDHLVYPLDNLDFDRHEAAVAEVEERFGPIDIMVLNAGIGQRGAELESTLDITRKIMDVNFTGTASLGRHIARHMVRRKAGHIVVTSSVLGRLAIPGSASYSASKFALHGFFEGLRAELYPSNVHVTLVCPGYINTEITLHAVQGDGSKFGVIDHNHTYGMPADVCARKVVRAVKRKKAVFLVGGKETWGVYAAQYLPALTRRLTRRYSRK